MRRGPAIPPLVVRVLRRQPQLLAAALGALNLFGRLPRGRAALVALSIAALAAAIAVSAAASGRAAWAVGLLLERGALLAAGSAVYGAALIGRRRREIAESASRSWLVATPEAGGRASTAAILLSISLLWRLLLLLALALLLATDAAIAFRQTLTLAAWAAAGFGMGSVIGLLVRRSPRAHAHEASHYTRRPRRTQRFVPSPAALASWPTAQALAWSRPENSRWLVLAATLSVPIGAGAVGGLAILAAWLATSYFAAVLAALPHVARDAAAWLRATPIAFSKLAWPIARGALWQQAAGAALAAAVMIAAGASPRDALELAGLWLALAALVAAVSLADCYRGRTPNTKIWLSALSALLAEQRVRGLGVAVALAVTAWHLRPGVTHERA